MIVSRLLVCCLLVMLAACAPKTRVILLPDEEGSAGKIVVQTPEASKEMDKAYTYTTVGGLSHVPAEVKSTTKEEVEREFRPVLEAQPKPPMHFTLYFEFDKKTLTKRSRALIPEVIRTVKNREAAEVSIIGHTDRAGSKAYNVRLSLERAEVIRKILAAAGLDIETMRVQSHGENDPRVPTADNVAEPRNRRVEIMIR